MKGFLSIDHRWTSIESSSLHRRDILDEPSTVMSLVPGGRWLLIASKRGEVYSYDLDSPSCPRSCLIEPEDRWDMQDPVHMCIFLDEHSGYLKFTLLIEFDIDSKHDLTCTSC